MLEETLQSRRNAVGKLLGREVAGERLPSMPLSQGRGRLRVLPGRHSRIHWIPLRTTCFFQVLGGEFGIFLIDNAHFLDPESWAIVWPLLQSVTVFVVLSLASGHDRTEGIFEAAADNATSQKITCRHLEGLKASAVVQKACRDLGVRSIPRDLAR